MKAGFLPGVLSKHIECMIVSKSLVLVGWQADEDERLVKFKDGMDKRYCNFLLDRNGASNFMTKP